jgi:hypothetical protein
MRALITLLTCSLAAAPYAAAQSRGELLYTTHCIACHTTEMHWRDKRSASNWPALKTQVRRWQDAASLAWGDSDILDVSRYLNETIYHFEQTADPVSSSGRGIHAPVSKVTDATIALPGMDQWADKFTDVNMRRQMASRLRLVGGADDGGVVATVLPALTQEPVDADPTSGSPTRRAPLARPVTGKKSQVGACHTSRRRASWNAETSVSCSPAL